MREMIWIFPILFIVHDMEEIIGLNLWLKKNMVLLDKKYPQISKIYKLYSTEGMAAAVMEEMVVCLVICIITRLTQFYGLWIGTFIAYTFHLLVHIVQSVVIRKYIPAVITSILCLPLSIWLIEISISALSYTNAQVLVYSIMGIVLITVNLKVAHWIMHVYTKKVVDVEV